MSESEHNKRTGTVNALIKSVTDVGIPESGTWAGAMYDAYNAGLKVGEDRIRRLYMLVAELCEKNREIRLVHQPLDKIANAIRTGWCCELYARDGEGHLPECRNYVAPYVPSISWISSVCGRMEPAVPGDVGKYRPCGCDLTGCVAKAEELPPF